MNYRLIARTDWSRVRTTIAPRLSIGPVAAVSALLVACGGQSSAPTTRGGTTTRSHTASVAPTATALPTFGPGGVSLNVADDLAAPVPANWEDRAADAGFASANGLPPDAKTELLIRGPGGGNGVTVPVLFVFQEPGDVIDAREFPGDLTHNGGGFGDFLVRSTGDLSIDGAYAYQVTVSATSPGGRAFEEWNVLVNHVGKDGKQHTYAIGFICSPDAFDSLFPTAQRVIGELTWL